MGDIEGVIKFISGLGVSGVLILLVYGLLRGWFVTGREHGILASLFTSLQADMTAMRNELRLLRDRDESQQKEINDLRNELTTEKALKQAALNRVDALTAENERLQRRVGELERVVGSGAGLVKHD